MPHFIAASNNANIPFVIVNALTVSKEMAFEGSPGFGVQYFPYITRRVKGDGDNGPTDIPLGEVDVTEENILNLAATTLPQLMFS